MDKGKRGSVKLGVICPMANERQTVESFIKEVLSYTEAYDTTMFVVLDNYSTDGTLDLLKKIEKEQPRLKVVWAPENRCVVDAYIRGYRSALEAHCQWILEIDAGYSHQPSNIPKFLEKMEEGYDCVFGSRFCNGGSYVGAPLSRYWISRGGSQLINLLLGTRLSDMTSGFELFTAQSLSHALNKGVYSKGHFFQSEIKVHCRSFHIAEVPIEYRNPSSNVTGKILADAFKNLKRLVQERMKGTL